MPWVARERAGALEAAEEVGRVVEQEPSRRTRRVDGHLADRVDREPVLDRQALAYGREHVDRLADVAQRLAPPGLVEDPIEIRCEVGGLRGEQDLAAAGEGRYARGEVDRRAEVVA